MADLLTRYGHPKEAETAYKTFIARDPGQPERVLAFAQFLALQNRGDEAMVILRKAWSTCRPEQVAEASFSLYNAPSAEESQRLQVESWVAEALRRQPGAVVLASKLGVIRIFQGRFDEAEGLFRGLLNRNPECIDALNNLAWLLALKDQNRVHEAAGLIDYAIDLAALRRR